MRVRSLRILVAKATLLVVSIGLSLAICELLMRALGYAAIYEVYSNPELLWRHDPVLGWSHEPSSRDEYVGPRPWPIEFRSEVEINSIGLRGPEPTPIAPEGIRILFLGDSMVAGFEVEWDETFCQRLEALLAQRLGRSVQVVNGGVRGYGSDQSFLYYRERGREHRPDLVLLWLSDNDLLDDLTIHRMRRIFGKPAFVRSAGDELRLVGSPVPIYPECSEYRIGPDDEVVRIDSLPGRVLCRLQLALFDRSALFSFATTLLTSERWGNLIRDLYYLGMPKPTGAPHEGRLPTEPPITHFILAQMEREVERDGAQFALVAPSEVLGRFAKAGVGIEPETAIALRAIEAADPKSVQFVHDSHYTPTGHQIVAEELAERLLPLLTSPEPAP